LIYKAESLNAPLSRIKKIEPFTGYLKIGFQRANTSFYSILDEAQIFI
jgi:hypothetical protein